MLLPVQRVKEKKNALGVDMKRLEIPFYNFPSTLHLKIILYAFKRTAKYFGNKSDFFVLEAMSEMFGKQKIQYNTLQFNKIQSKAMRCNTMQYNTI